MKKILQLAAFSAIIFDAAQSKGQVVAGSTASDWTLTDINGVSRNLYSYLNAGKTVFIDCSETSCYNCMIYHQSGAFDSIWANHGPLGEPGVHSNSTNDCMVFFIETNATTTSADLHGTGTNTLCDWVTGVHYPIFDPTFTTNPTADGINYFYNVTVYPAVIMICPNRTMTEVDGFTASQLYNARASCPSSPPIADFTAVSSSGCTTPHSVTFTDNSYYAVTSWAWDIDNNGTVDYTTQSPTHTYTTPGIYTVKLVVTNANGSNTIIKTNYVSAGTVIPVISTAITSGSNAICSGTSVTFSAASVNGGTSPNYQWYLNGAAISGAVNQTLTTSSMANNNVVTCKITSTGTCPASSISAGITMSVTPAVVPAANISITSGTATICSGTSAAFTAATNNSGTSPIFHWQVNGVNAGTNSISFSPAALANGDIVTCVLTSNAICASPSTVTSSIVTITVNPIVSPSVAIALTAGTNPTCAGVPNTFTASSVNGGSSPVYQWKQNGINTVIGTTFTTSSVANGDIITCALTSNAGCLSSNTAVSSGSTISLIPFPAPNVSVAISSGTNPSCHGSSVTFTAAPVNAGTNPGYQWYLDGNAVAGAHSSTFTPPSVSDGNVIKCMVTSNAACPGTPMSNAITLAVPAVAAINFISNINVCGGTIPAAIFSSNPSGASYAWTNSNAAIGLALNGTGNIPSFNAVNTTSAPITSTITVAPSMNGCPGIPASFNITINPTPVITQNGSVLTSSHASTYQWYLNGQPLSGDVNQQCTASQNGNYIVITDAGNCPSSSFNVNASGITSLSSNSFFTAYPNPNDGNFTVSFEVPQKDTYILNVENAIGVLVYKETLSDFAGKYSKQMSLGSFAKGMYLVSLSNSDNKIVNKIIVY